MADHGPQNGPVDPWEPFVPRSYDAAGYRLQRRWALGEFAGSDRVLPAALRSCDQDLKQSSCR